MKLDGLKITLLIAITVFFSACSDGVKQPENVYTKIHQKKVPLFLELENSEIFEIIVDISEKPLKINRFDLVFQSREHQEILRKIEIYHQIIVNENVSTDRLLFGNTTSFGRKTRINGDIELAPGKHRFTIDFLVLDDVLLERRFSLDAIELFFGRSRRISIGADNNFRYRPAKVLRAAGQDDCDTYRIPGIITTTEGTLIAVYDNRYNNSKDLQEDIDVGMSRSTNGGQTWEPMRVIMDMGEWGGRPRRLNGIGDPAVLYDHTTGTIWVAALWISGSHYEKMLWWDSNPGMLPEETGQFVLAKSTDDGLTWSDPINITEQIKDPAWQLLLAGPGMGITLDDGTLIFAAQFKEDIGVQALDGGQYTCHSTIVYSKDGGETWQIGTGAKPNTTEAQVVQLADGTLMLNMRDDLNRRVKDQTNGRAVSITRDLGKTWEMHPSSNSALPESNCMASLIAHNMRLDGRMQQVLFFSNPNDKHRRVNMTIKASFDAGNSWPEMNQVLLNEAPAFGYSCMTMVDDNTIGILYEGVKELFFQKIPISEILRDY